MLNLLRRSVIPLAALIVSFVVLAVSLRHPAWLWLLVVTLPLVALGIYDFWQRGFTITRNYPVAGRIRWFFYDLRPYLRAYIVEDDLNGTPFSFEARNLVHARARGKADSHPFGTERDTDSHEYFWLTHSIAPVENPEKDPRVTVGNDQTGKPYDASILNISAMSFGALSANAVRALNLAASKGGFYHDTGEGGLSKYHLENGGDIVWELGSGYFGARDGNGRFDPEKFREKAQHDHVKMTEIKLSQGAKPGHGGLLPAAKVTEEIAEVRQIPANQDCLSPRGHSAFSTPIEMLEFAAKMRDLSGGKPVGIKLCVGQPHEVFAIMKAILKTGITPEFIVVDGGEGGTGAAPLELSDWVGMPLREGLILMRNALVGTGLKSKIRLAASGKVYSGMGMAHAMAMGADWCNAARAFMFSIGCIQAQRCHTGTCPTGVTTQDPLRMRALVPEVQAERAERFHRKTIEALGDIVAAAGVSHPRDLEPHLVMHRTGPEKAETMDRIFNFLPEGALLDAPEETLYASWWKAASAETFRPVTDLPDARASKGEDKTSAVQGATS